MKPYKTDTLHFSRATRENLNVFLSKKNKAKMPVNILLKRLAFILKAHQLNKWSTKARLNRHCIDR